MAEATSASRPTQGRPARRRWGTNARGETGWASSVAVRGLLAVAGLIAVLAAPAALSAQEPKGSEFATGEASLEEADLPEGLAAEPGSTVDDVRVAGNRRVEAESILDRAKTTEGSPLDRKRISRDIRNIYGLGYFADVKVDATETPNGEVLVTFVVLEKPAIGEIRYEGNQEVDDDTLKEKVTLKKNTILDVNRVKKSVEKIRKTYTDKGYYLAEVDYDIRLMDEKANRVAVVYEIQEFQKVQVKRITLLGNENIPDQELKRTMKTREGSFLSIISEAGNFVEEDFQSDLQRLTAYYYDKGYVEVDVGTPSIRLSKDKQFLFITIRIDEGKQYSVGSVSLKGDMLVDREKLRKKVNLEKNETFSYGQMRRDSETLKKFYQDRGYAYAEAKPLTRINRGAQTVDVTFQLKQNKKVYFKRVEVRGNQKTSDKVIRRELEIQPGELYSNKAVERSKRQVKRLGYFKNVDVTTQKASEADRINATVQVKERRTGNFQVGAGFSSTESFIFNAKVSQKNLLGRGQSLSLQARVSAIRQMFNLRFTEPWLFDTRWQFSFRGFNFEYAFQDFTRESTGGDLTFGYPISEPLNLDIPGDLVAQGSYKLERVQIEAGGRSGISQRPGSFFAGGITSSVGAELQLDTRNNRLFPTEGQYHTAGVEYADRQVTFSETEFLKYDFESRVYFPLVWEFVLRLNGELGYITSLSPNRRVPLFERYLVGGPRSMRGFEYSTLGPTERVARNGGDPGSSLSDFHIGGNKQLLLTAEIEFPILTAAGLKGVVFADAGNAFDSGQPFTLALDLFEDPDDRYRDVLRTAVGLGVRWRSPLGPLRFEWGFPLQRLRGERPRVFHFTIGNAF